MKFYRVWPEAPYPTRADRSLGGSISSRAHQFCEPFLVANSMGYHIYPPTDFNLIWDGTYSYVQFPDIEEWILIDKIFLPDSIDIWKGIVDEDLIDALPIFLEAFPERGVLQLWTGYFAETMIGDSLWIRGPVNINESNSYRIIEGIVESDWWAGPLFTTIEFTKTDIPIQFKKDKPILQIFPIPKLYQSKEQKFKAEMGDFAAIASSDFRERVKQTASRRNSGKPGTYRKECRR